MPYGMNEQEWIDYGKIFLQQLRLRGFNSDSKPQMDQMVKWYEKEYAYSPLFIELYCDAPEILAKYYMDTIWVDPVEVAAGRRAGARMDGMYRIRMDDMDEPYGR